ncbi:hypothetical protein ACFS5L_06490 [Streptomyces phyllanthi]|uniref:Uncharacterized protein n=1 Tax=Streptomyces phyllanthi TaxID=1803180 RepID=A0A5N8VUZ4_9ACTN|nr:hypothetical protein [Streptomyces phyllanthi]MPY39080.1 hypothetical protein [Streptomyces phyllanthi]
MPDSAGRPRVAEHLAGQGRVTDLDGFLTDIAVREEQMPTGLEPARRGLRRPGGPGRPDLHDRHADGADDAHLSILSAQTR